MDKINQLAANTRIRQGFVRGISDETVLSKTGKTWDEWSSILDTWGAPHKGYSASTRHIRNEYEISTWWANTIIVRYEYERGFRD